MKITHDYAARIDYDLWMDCLKVKELDGEPLYQRTRE